MSKAFKHAFDKLTHHEKKDKSGNTSSGENSRTASPAHTPGVGHTHGHGQQLPHINTAGSTASSATSATSASNTTTATTVAANSSAASSAVHLPSDVNSPVASGQTTPTETHSNNHKGGLFHHKNKKDATTTDLHAKDHAAAGEGKDDHVHRTGSLNSACSDLHEHFKAIKLHHGKSNEKTTSAAAVAAGAGAGHGTTTTGATRPHLEHRKTEEDERALRVERAEELEREHLAREAAAKEAYEKDPLKANYGFLNIDATPNNFDISGKKDTLLEIAKKKEGDQVFFRARLQSHRNQSAKLAFVIFRQRYQEIQGVLALKEGEISENMVRFVEHLPPETIVLVRAIVQEPHAHGQTEIKYTSIHNVEVRIQTLHVVSQVTVAPPFNIHDASRPETDFADDAHGHQISARMHFANRAASLRTPVNQAIFQIRAAICHYFRSYLVERGFTEIQSSKFQQGATESGASVFKVDYFKRNASLAQSPQLAKQLCMAADMERVFEIGPVFRAENSQTARHLTEFVGMDLEMQIDNDYHEVINMLAGMFVNMFQGLQKNQKELVDVVRRQHPSSELVVPDETIIITFKEAIHLLNESGYREDGEMLSEFEDFSTPAEKYLGKIMKEKYNTDFYVVDKFPASVRPFYTMPDPVDPRFSNSADFFLRGQEILSGGQRIHHAPLLEKKIVEAKIDPKDMKEYLDGFRWGCPPHGGGGIGLERVLFLFLDLQNVRWASLLPRDPKSFPEDTTPHGGKSIRGPECNLLDYDTAKRRGQNPPLPSLEDLIATYGDAANTVYLDPSWEVWRDTTTGAACGFKESEGHALAWGRPLCPDSMLKGVLDRFLHYLKKERKLKPIFACIDETTEQILASKDYDWRSLSVAAEERIDPTVHNPNSQTSKSNLAKKTKQAQNAGVKVVVCDGLPDEKVRKAIDIRMQDWKHGREGKQIHTTDLLPWDDPQHRRYFYAVDKQGKYVALVVLAQLAPVHGWQIKYSLSFPDGPSGSIELLLSTAILTLGEAGCHSATFGTSAATHLGKGSHQSAIKMRTLSAAYDAITTSFHLLTKPEFRAKFGSEQDPVYLAYPKHGGLGVSGIQALIHALSD